MSSQGSRCAQAALTRGCETHSRAQPTPAACRDGGVLILVLILLLVLGTAMVVIMVLVTTMVIVLVLVMAMVIVLVLVTVTVTVCSFGSVGVHQTSAGRSINPLELRTPGC